MRFKTEIERVAVIERWRVRQQIECRQPKQTIRTGDNLISRNIRNLIQPRRWRDSRVEIGRAPERVGDIADRGRIRLYRLCLVFFLPGLAAVEELIQARPSGIIVKDGICST